MPDENDPTYRAYRRNIWDNDAQDQEPISVGKNILILPWNNSKTPDEGRTVIHMDSRYAFGDGRHPTTNLCLTLLEEFLAGLTPREKSDLHMLDMGTGTGVLAILASLMGLDNILALDIDPEAIDSAGELAVRNGCPSIEFRVMDATFLPAVPSYGLITANLLPPVLRFIIPLAARLLLPRAPVIISGIGDTSQDEMETVMKDSGFTDITRITSGWWHAYLIRR